MSQIHFNHTKLFLNSFIDGSPLFPWYHIHRESIIPGISDKAACFLGNILAYWLTSFIYHGLDISQWKWLEKYRIQESEEVKNKNLVTGTEVVRLVAFQQIMQTILGYLWLNHAAAESEALQSHVVKLRQLFESIARVVFLVMGEERGHRFMQEWGFNVTYNMYWWIIPIAQCVSALLIWDTYQYFIHRMFHEVKFLYKHVHSMHHRLYVPFAFGALYQHPFEGFISEGLGVTLSHSLAGLSDRQAILLFAFAAYKNVDDHCGYYFPWHPTHMIFGNNSVYHDIHHQHAGIKSNYSQPFFMHWDVVLGTRMTMEQLLARRTVSRAKKTKSH